MKIDLATPASGYEGKLFASMYQDDSHERLLEMLELEKEFSIPYFLHQGTIAVLKRKERSVELEIARYNGRLYIGIKVRVGNVAGCYSIDMEPSALDEIKDALSGESDVRIPLGGTEIASSISCL